MSRRLIRGKMVIDGTDKPPIMGGAVLMEADRILSVGAENEIQADSDTEVIDCGDQVLLPGLIDCHNHLSLDTTMANYPSRMSDSIPDLTLRAVSTMKIDLQSGVTFARCCGDKEFLDIACKQAVESGRLEGPRLKVATRGIRAVHGSGCVGYPFDGLEPIRTAVRENINAGADLIKLYITGSLKGDEGIPSYLSKSEISLAVHEARRVGVKSAVHCIGGQGLDWALELGINSVEHGYFISDDQIERMLKSETWLVLTPSPYFAQDRIQTLPPGGADRVHRQREEVMERLGAAIKAGVSFAVGTDGRHGGLAQEMRYLVEMGASAQAVLWAATRNGAAVCGLEDHIGTLEPGKIADIIGVAANPLEDIRVLQSVETIIQGGIVRRVAGRPVR